MASSHLFRLPLILRQKIYSYLLAPHPEEDVTTINYSLEWPFLQNPRNSTFTPHQLDLCRCPQQHPRPSNIPTEDHIYTRYICQGPVVRFTRSTGDLWLLMAPNGPFNILRPASNTELQQRPSASIVLVNRLIYKEALPFLYSYRNFLFLTGPCPRGRYQAYATEIWLSRLSPYAREQVTSLSLICQVWEEDCQHRNFVQAYTSLALCILENTPNCRNLCLNHLSDQIPLYPFGLLFRRKGMSIFTKRNLVDGKVSEYHDLSSFQKEYNPQTYKDTRQKGLENLQHCGLSDGPTVVEENIYAEDIKADESSTENLGGLRPLEKSKAREVFGNDWVLAGLSPTGSNSELESDHWEMI